MNLFFLFLSGALRIFTFNLHAHLFLKILYCFFSYTIHTNSINWTGCCNHRNRGVDKSLARPGRKQATATDDFDVYVSYL